jgi:hypothetical protein
LGISTQPARLDQQQQMTQIATSQPVQGKIFSPLLNSLLSFLTIFFLVIDYAAIAEAMKPLIAEALPAGNSILFSHSHSSVS